MVLKPKYFQNRDEELLETGEYASPSYNASTSATTYSYRSSQISPARRVPAWDQNSELPPPVSTRERRLMSSSKSDTSFGSTYSEGAGGQRVTRADAQTLSYSDTRHRRLDPEKNSHFSC